MLVESSWAPVNRPPTKKSASTVGIKRSCRLAIVCPVCLLFIFRRRGTNPGLLHLYAIFLAGGESFCHLRQHDLALAELFAGFSHGTSQRRPVLNVGGKNIGYHVPGEFRYEAIEHDGGIALLVCQARP